MLEIYPLASTYITCLEDDTYKLCLSFLFLFTICMIMIKKIEYSANKYNIMLMLMHRLNTTMGINVKQIMPKELSKVQDGELALHNRKTVTKIKNLEWNSETKVSTLLLQYEFIVIGNCLCVL